MDVVDDPLLTLAAELERVSAAQLALAETTTALIGVAPPADREILREAARAMRHTARTTAGVSATVLVGGGRDDAPPIDLPF